MTPEAQAAVAAIADGLPVVVPTDTVYGLASTPHSAEAVRRMYAAKGRDATTPSALLASSVELLLGLVPEIEGRAADAARALLPGPYTLVVPNPARRFAWLCGETPDAIGVRVPAVSGVARALLELVGAVAATSANLPGGPAPRRAEDVTLELRARVAVVVDGGELPGTASTVLDLTGSDPVVLRVGAVPAATAIAAVEASVRGG